MKPLYLFHGEDSYTAIQKALHWQSQFRQKYGDINVETFEGADLTAEKFAEAVSTLPFLSDKKLIVIRNFFKDAEAEELKKVSEKLDHIDENCIVVFAETQKADARTALFKNIKKTGEIKDFPLMDKPQLADWITAEIARLNAPISRSQINILADTVGPNLWQMKQEIEKIALFCAAANSATDNSTNNPAASPTDKEIENLISPNLQTSIFRLTDQLAQKNRRDALKTLKTLIESGENLIPIMFMIVRQFRILIQIQSCAQKGLGTPAIIKKIKLHPFVVSSGLKQAGNFSPEKLKEIYDKLLKIDIGTKNSKIKITVNDATELRLA
ncbi:DNA polymerase III subunit delta, partial [Patescibacteria group bacterium]|nr:DNA polymerase III subunit delta [Patescibacteria group bacterium]